MDGFELTYVSKSNPTTSQTFYYQLQTTGDFKGSVMLDYDLADRGNGNTSEVAGVDLPDFVFLYYYDTEYFSAVVSNIPAGAGFDLTIFGTSGNIQRHVTEEGGGAH